ncbi:hypothetical protein [Halanaeroarchaeum sulfurireducens]|uniref:Uncharacterized protein n=1 Tax=Halanaeroarchaeum sulfurireducens TaxID=1604004 RepID=A0A0F7PD31_9EURY|nr:hypothetical protein [Halanaeroarchaeum sulfurireducens]AKH98632.1 hypothetical protein HLASF_3006 [Halanaeroarchaeum sulfurireducens]ALG83074.1 hypothetical protein HLASA_3006 [Halanaeroarchaeum sulfurireducens]
MTDDESSGMSAGRREREAMYPDNGCVLVRIDYNSPPGEALEQVATYESLDGIHSIPEDTDWEGYVVYDSDGNAYSNEDL